MKRAAVALLAIIALLPPLSTAANTTWVDVAERLMSTVIPLTYENDKGGCSGFVIDTERDYVLTAAHCGADKVYVDQVPATEVAKDVKKDLLVLHVEDIGDDRPALKLAAKDPKTGEEVASLGFGYALEKPMFRIAHVANVNVQVPDAGNGGPYVVFDSAFVGGQSGGPVINAQGELVAIVQMASANVGLGVGAETIKSKVGRYFQRNKS